MATSQQFSLELRGLGTFRSSLDRFNWMRIAVMWADRVQKSLTDALRLEAPVSERDGRGRLRDGLYSTRETSGGNVTIRWWGSTPYVGYVIGGTAPHDIRPVSALALRFDSGGGSRFSELVHHPGTKPNDFVSRVWDREKLNVVEAFNQVAREALS